MSAPTPWTLNRVINRADGVILVWRAAQYEGGTFNGFDRTPVVISRAEFQAYFSDGKPGAARPVTLDHVWESGQPGSADPRFIWVGNRLLPHDCYPSNPVATVGQSEVACGSPGQAGASFRQLGSRAEQVRSEGTFLVLGSGSGCRLNLEEISADSTRPYEKDIGSARFGIAYFPDLSIAYVLDHSSLALYSSTKCQPLQKVLAAGELGAPGDLEVIDIVPTEGRADFPGLLVGWAEQVRGAYQQRFGVSSGGTTKSLPELARDPVGFWSTRASVIVLDVAESASGSADIHLLDMSTSQATVLQAAYPLPPPRWLVK